MIEAKDPEVLSRQDPGMDWGAKRRLLARSADGEITLFIRGGHSMGMGMRGMGQTYVKAALILCAPGVSYGSHLAEGRISAQTFREPKIAQRIDEAFGCPDLHRVLDPRHTFEVTPGEP